MAFPTFELSVEGWIETFKRMGALWKHSGDPKQPHALLTSGKHSDGFFNGSIITEEPTVLDIIMHQLSSRIGAYCFEADRVVGPAMGAVTLAHDLARSLRVKTSYAEKALGPDGKTVIKMIFKRNPPKVGERVITAEDTTTTGGSVEKVARAIEACGAIPSPFYVAIFNRSGLTHIGDKPIVALIDMPMQTWEAHECPLCKAGSEAIKPKEPQENWQRLTEGWD